MDSERRLVRKERFELSRYCYRQPLKLVRLPVPPLSLRWVLRFRLKAEATRTLIEPCEPSEPSEPPEPISSRVPESSVQPAAASAPLTGPPRARWPSAPD